MDRVTDEWLKREWYEASKIKETPIPLWNTQRIFAQAVARECLRVGEDELYTHQSETRIRERFGITD